MRKKDRHRLIARLLNENVIQKQEEFVEILKAQGIEVTQATISRDIKELKLIKIPALTGGYQYAMPTETKENLEERLNRLLKEALVNVKVMEKFVFLQTVPGNAAAVSQMLEKQMREQIFATLNDDAGILLIANSEAEAQALEKYLLAYL
ncbi:transcriptional regulator of arginine metabolism [Enterococcus sp. PF1-24]|uniref:arginine repressor n=1 Tax=unclassified Enterococcus TaxID=2608891 RepID=UPI002475493C|nr:MULTISPECIES: ArgR family transcriptional regulator [unclassified Enterococcus]MDH6364435.1 transcriptional regulator of arginine metabolism [Enterococcus sp. PFB1-1]MDH6401542.1 transcriptional regulator of arginine metabolism [Enterococcus sp. PF1-24]